MCNDYRLLTDAATIFADFSQLKIKIRFSEGKPNLEARENMRITDTAPIVCTIQDEPRAGDLSFIGGRAHPVSGDAKAT
jgi:putative SOS response-associated peptidase YedK